MYYGQVLFFQRLTIVVKCPLFLLWKLELLAHPRGRCFFVFPSQGGGSITAAVLTIAGIVTNEVASKEAISKAPLVAGAASNTASAVAASQRSNSPEEEINQQRQIEDRNVNSVLIHEPTTLPTTDIYTEGLTWHQAIHKESLPPLQSHFTTDK